MKRLAYAALFICAVSSTVSLYAIERHVSLASEALAFMAVQNSLHSKPARPKITAASLRPEVFVNTSVAYQTCARPDGTAAVKLFITRVGMPHGLVTVKLQNGFTTTLLADPTAVFEIERAGLGAHEVIVTTPEGRTGLASWSVYRCPVRSGGTA